MRVASESHGKELLIFGRACSEPEIKDLRENSAMPGHGSGVQSGNVREVDVEEVEGFGEDVVARFEGKGVEIVGEVWS